MEKAVADLKIEMEQKMSKQMAKLRKDVAEYMTEALKSIGK